MRFSASLNQSITGSHRWWIVLSLALLTRVILAGLWQARLPADHPFAFDDSETYWALADTIRHGQPYAYGEARIFRTPGYPCFLALVMWLMGPSPLLARIAGACLGTVAVALIMLIAKQRFNERTAWLAGLIAALDPASIGMSCLILSEALFAPFLVLSIWVTIRMLTMPPGPMQQGTACGAGVLAGMATLIRPSWLLFVPGLALLLVMASSDRRATVRSAAVMLLGFVLALTPWWVRNYQVTGIWVPTTLQVGASLYDAWGPAADGASDMRFVPDFVAAQQHEDQQVASSLPWEVRLDRRMQQAALHWAWHNPRRVVELMIVKFNRMWSPWPHAAEFRHPAVAWAIALSYVPSMVAALWCAWRLRKRGWDVVLCWLPAAYLAGLHMVFIGSIRYRQPAMLLLFVLAAAQGDRWLTELGFSPRVASRAPSKPREQEGNG